MSLLVYNLTAAPLTLANGLATVIPASTAGAGVRGLPWYASGSELKGRSVPEYTALQTQQNLGLVTFEWQAAPEYNTYPLQVGSAQTDVSDLDVMIYLDPISGDDSLEASIRFPVKTMLRAQALKAMGWRKSSRIRYAAGALSIPDNAPTFLASGPSGNAASPETWIGTAADQFGAFATDTRALPTLSAVMSAIDTVANVTSTAGLPATGTVLIGFESCAYSSITPTSFVGLVRGANATTHAIGAPVIVTSVTHASTVGTSATAIVDSSLPASFRSGAAASITAIAGTGQAKTMTVTGMTGLAADDVGKQFLFGLATNISSANTATTSVTVALATSPNLWNISGLTGGLFSSASVGNYIKVAGMTSPGNNGIFRIIAGSAETVRVFNPAGVAEGPTVTVTWGERGLSSSRTGNNGFFKMASFISATSATFFNAQALVEASALIYWQDSYRGSYIRMTTGAANAQNARCIEDHGTEATGALNVIAVASLVDNDNFFIPDGTGPGQTFEYKVTGGFVPVGGRVTIDVSTLVTVGDVALATAAAINAVAPTTLRVRASNTAGNAQVQVKNMLPGSSGNVTITEAVANAGFTVSGFTGGVGSPTTTFSFPAQAFSPAPASGDQYVVERAATIFSYARWEINGERTLIGMQNVLFRATSSAGDLIFLNLVTAYDRVEFDLFGGTYVANGSLNSLDTGTLGDNWANDTAPRPFSNQQSISYVHNGSYTVTGWSVLVGSAIVLDSANFTIAQAVATPLISAQRTTAFCVSLGVGGIGGGGSRMNGTFRTQDAAILSVDRMGAHRSSFIQIDNSSGAGLLVQNGSQAMIGNWSGSGNALAGIAVNNRSGISIDHFGSLTTLTGTRGDFEFGHETVPNVRTYAEVRTADGTGVKGFQDTHLNRVDAP